MKLEKILERASAGLTEVAQDWMPASYIRPFMVNDPGQIWLDKFGWKHGFFPAPATPYDYLNYQFSLDHAFREKWRARYASDIAQVCQEAYQVRYKFSLEHTLCLMADVKNQVIYQPALWWAPDCIYGMPNFLVRTSWLKNRFKDAYKALETVLGEGAVPDQYVILETRFSKSSGKEGEKANQILHEQLSLNNYVLSQLQGWAAPYAFLVTSVDPERFISFDVACSLGDPLKSSLKNFLSHFKEIVNNGENLSPWVDDQVRLDLNLDNDKWKTARKRIAWEIKTNGDPIVLHQIRENHKEKLAALNYKSLDDLLKAEPTEMPLEDVGITNYAGEIRAILQANRTNLPVLPAAKPGLREFEFFVDFEYFPDLGMGADPLKKVTGEMIFMIGVGKSTPAGWVYKDFIAEKIGKDEELRMLNEFTQYLRQETKGAHLDHTRTALYHWSKAEISQSKKAVEHHSQGLDGDFQLLPWIDLLDCFKSEGCAIPGAWNYSLKSVAKALGKIDPKYDPHWIGDLDDGSGVVVLGFTAYLKKKEILKTDEMMILQQYLQSDCSALSKVLSWMRDGGPGAKFGETGLAYVGWNQVKKEYQERKPRTAYAGLNQGKGVIVYLHPGLPNKKGEPTGIQPLNHLIWGDWLEILDEQDGWYKVHARNTYGWMHKNWVQQERLLEVNFIDVAQGDGCLVVTPLDQKIIIDAGEADNMFRFLRWRFGRFQKPVEFESMVITHPDQDHYAGFSQFFKGSDEIQNIKFKSIFHNGIIDEKSTEIEIQKAGKTEKISIVSPIIQTRAELREILKKPSTSNFLTLLRSADESGRVGDIRMLSATSQGIRYLPGFEKGETIEIEVLGPVLESTLGCDYLRWLSGGGKTKNGHSVVLRLKYGDVRILLGGDLNDKSEDFLLTHYANLATHGGSPEGEERIATSTGNSLKLRSLNPAIMAARISAQISCKQLIQWQRWFPAETKNRTATLGQRPWEFWANMDAAIGQ